MKRLLRSKANFEILEGFLSELLHEDIIILEILESESNKENQRDKFNRVDLKVKNSAGEIIIIEVQHEREYDFLKNEEIRDEFKAKGLQKAKKAFSLLNQTEKERLAYERYQDDLHYQASLIESNYGLGLIEGREEGEKRKALDVASKMKQMGVALEDITTITGLTKEEIP